MIARNQKSIEKQLERQGILVEWIEFKKGSSAQNLLLGGPGDRPASLGPTLRRSDLSPADAAAAFDRDSIDAWSIWDPFFAVAQDRYAPRCWRRPTKTLDANTFLLANPAFPTAHPGLIRDAITALGRTATGPRPTRARSRRPCMPRPKWDLAALERAIGRASFSRPPDRRPDHQEPAGDRRPVPGAGERSRSRS